VTELPPTTNETAAEQCVLFDLGAPSPAAAQPTFLQPLATSEPQTAGNTKRERSRSKIARPATAPSGPTRLEIEPEPQVPEPSPILLAAVRAALLQTLAQESQALYQSLVAGETPPNDTFVLAVEPARLGAAAQLLLDAPALNLAVSLLALGAMLREA
jgi:hypothetical protein